METIRLARDADRPVRFPGEELARVSGHTTSGTGNTRWYTLTLYQHEDRRYVLAWTYHTQWQGEHAHNAVHTCASLEEAMRAFEVFDPLVWLEGFKGILARHPAYQEEGHASGYAARQARLEQELTAQYRRLTSELATILDMVDDL
jgi:hypothetical protein